MVAWYRSESGGFLMFTAPYLVLLGLGLESCLLLTPKGPRESTWFSGASPLPPRVFSAPS